MFRTYMTSSLLLIITLGFQNCSEVKFKTSGPNQLIALDDSSAISLDDFSSSPLADKFPTEMTEIPSVPDITAPLPPVTLIDMDDDKGEEKPADDEVIVVDPPAPVEDQEVSEDSSVPSEEIVFTEEDVQNNASAGDINQVEDPSGTSPLPEDEDHICVIGNQGQARILRLSHEDDDGHTRVRFACMTRVACNTMSRRAFGQAHALERRDLCRLQARRLNNELVKRFLSVESNKEDRNSSHTYGCNK